MVKNQASNAGDECSVSELRRSPGGGNGNPLLYSSLGSPMDRGAWWARGHGVAKSQTQLEHTHTHTHMHTHTHTHTRTRTHACTTDANDVQGRMKNHSVCVIDMTALVPWTPALSEGCHEVHATPTLPSWKFNHLSHL